MTGEGGIASNYSSIVEGGEANRDVTPNLLYVPFRVVAPSFNDKFNSLLCLLWLTWIL